METTMSQDIHEIAQGPVEAFRGNASRYYRDAESSMEIQWSGLIWPLIKDFNFENTLDFAAGYGRNSVLLASLAKHLYVVEANPDAVRQLEARFNTPDPNQCSIQIIQNNGLDLRDISPNTITALYSFDSMVHFEKRLVEAYMPEFERVMAHGAYGFIHHSNFGRVSQDPDFHNHPGWRSNVDKDWFAQCCFRPKLLPVRQTPIAWHIGEVGFEEFDCISIVYKLTNWLA
jgi:hypothetical protein